MTVDESTAADSGSAAQPHLTVVHPPPGDAGTIDLRSSTDAPTSLADLQIELSNLRARVQALETDTAITAPVTPPEIPSAVTEAPLQQPPQVTPTTASTTSPTWRSKTARAAGWQPARR